MAARKSHVGYGVLVIIALILTVVALFTPGWRSYKGSGAPDIGLVSRNCGNGNRQVLEYDCALYQKHQLPFEKTTLAFMIIALILEILSVFVFCGMFKAGPSLGSPALVLNTLAFVSLFIAVLVYGVRIQYKYAYMQSTTYELLANVYLGYSYWITVIATFLMFFATATSGGLVKPEERIH
ncbi:unnamed protein product [Caenorhabditis angaria]|uniref:Uncharacterized protein n=1 Tax=Caenorhabditis angaria TaxID=860376 RepID=A0A9P1IET7_9PELO|nr:unnamed protein product [Caenorhabditis angaria]